MRISGTATGIRLALVLWAAPSLAGEVIHRCDTAQGPVFSDRPCGENSRKIKVMPEGFVLPGTERSAAAQLERMRELRKQGTPEAKRQHRQDSERLGYGERAELRRLRIRRDGLERDLRGAPRGSRRQERLQDELEDTKAAIARLAARE